MNIDPSDFGSVGDVPVRRFRCRNDRGLELELSSYGAIVLAVRVPDRNGAIANVNLGFDDLSSYLAGHPYFGATVGRFANRIADGRLVVDDEAHQLTCNEGRNHLHGGTRGFDKAVWNHEILESDDVVGVAFSRTSPDGEEGYPGNLDVRVTYLLSNDARFIIRFEAETDRATHVNLTSHCYWNLAGTASGSVRDQRLELAASRYVEVDSALIPTGRLGPVAGSCLDFRSGKRLGMGLDTMAAGYDHCYVLDDHDGDLRFAARVVEPGSGRVMSVYTTQPGVQLYTGNGLDGSHGCGSHTRHGALCLEAQHLPDSPNQPHFPSTRLDPGDRYEQRTEYRFSVVDY